MKKELQLGDLALSSLDAKGFEDYLASQLKKDIPNPHFIPTMPTYETMRHLRKELLPERIQEGGVKNSTRVRAGKELLASLSNCAVLGALKEKVPLEAFINTDGMSVLLGDSMSDTPTLFCTKGTKELLGTRNLLPSLQRDGQRCRGFNFIFTHSWGHRFLCGALMIKADEFAKRRFFPLEAGLAVWQLPKTYDRESFYLEYFEFQIIPALKIIRTELVALNTRASMEVLLSPQAAAVLSHDAVGAAAAPAVVPVPLVSYLDISAVSTTDGEYAQVESMMSQKGLDLLKRENVNAVKHAAAASLFQNTADIGPMHRQVRTLLKELCSDTHASPSVSMRKFLVEFANSALPGAEKQLFTCALERIEVVVSKAFNQKALAFATRAGGYNPWSIPQQLSAWASWPSMNAEQASQIIEYELELHMQTVIIYSLICNFNKHCGLFSFIFRTVPDLISCAAVYGKIPHAEYKRIMQEHGFDFEPYEQRGPDEMKVDDKSLNQQYTLWLNHDHLVAEKKARRALAAQKLEEIDRARQQKALEKAARDDEKKQEAEVRAVKKARKMAAVCVFAPG